MGGMKEGDAVQAEIKLLPDVSPASYIINATWKGQSTHIVVDAGIQEFATTVLELHGPPMEQWTSSYLPSSTLAMEQLIASPSIDFSKPYFQCLDPFEKKFNWVSTVSKDSFEFGPLPATTQQRPQLQLRQRLPQLQRRP